MDSGSKSSNTISGATNNAVQIGEVRGDFHFHAVAPATFPVPRQLPPDVPGFINQEAHLSRLSAWLRPSAQRAPLVQVIAGVGGVGKTSLVTHWAHRVRDWFSDGDLFVDLHGYHPDRVVSAGAALSAMLRALNVSGDRIPTTVDAMSGLYRSLLHERRVLVFLDNASSVEQVRPLLPGSPSCRVVITSRSQLGGLVVRNGAHCMPLDVLSHEHATSLLRRVIGDRAVAEPGAVDQLAGYCGYLPLALHIAAEQLVARPGARVSDLVAELTDERERLDVLATPGDESSAVRAVFALSYGALPAAAARAYRLLGFFAGQDIGLPAAAALLGLGAGQTRRVLAELTSVHLLTEKDNQRYQLHDLLRLHAAERAEIDEPADERSAALSRLMTWYAHATRAAVREIIPFFSQIPVELARTATPVPDFPDRAAALAWSDLELPNLTAGIRQAAALGDHEQVWRLAVLMFGILLVRRPHADWLATHEAGLVSARACGEIAAQAWLLTSVAIAERELRDPERALGHVEQALECWRADGTRWGVAWALRDTAATHHQLGRHAEAIAMFEQALAMHRADGDTWGEATALAGLTKAHVGNGELDTALAESRRALHIRREHEDSRNIGQALNDVGRVHLAMRDFQEAIECAEQGLDLLVATDYWHGQAISHELLGDALHGAGRREEALARWRMAADLYGSLGDPHANEVRARLSS
ncbi:tetratricopeptide repeat protein [Actinokineospora diospyrosa]|uniref:NB-ARC domain-containing protein n=1 Tax=Actinokineospora diospyrosa TaxID=103728 RepID=A0ABT1IKA3_9PSEU|nr:tetratricopeptide repeat protein [Actinokineospora diospyrosa]MCP2272641.1 NB-ARC domain-containing protein [Actinokineospora diospyrosa]